MVWMRRGVLGDHIDDAEEDLLDGLGTGGLAHAEDDLQVDLLGVFGLLVSVLEGDDHVD